MFTNVLLTMQLQFIIFLFYYLSVTYILASEWIKNRKIISSTFKTSMLQKFFDTFVQESLSLTEELENIEQSGNEVILLQYLERCTLRISCGKTTHLYYFYIMYRRNNYKKQLQL